MTSLTALPNPVLPERLSYLRMSPALAAWIAAGKELPDPSRMRSIPNLPDPLEGVAGPEGWAKRRQAIMADLKRYAIGTYPDRPANLRARVVEETVEQSGLRVREIELRFGPGERALLRFELLLPAASGPSVPPVPSPADPGKTAGGGTGGTPVRFPVFMTQRNHPGWARIAAGRGYAAVAYNGADDFDDTQAFKEIWPEHDWSMLCRRAWGAGVVLDYLHTLAEIDREKACITGHSRNGKLSLICGAIDERFIVIASSSGLGGATPWRLSNEAHYSEGLDLLCNSFPEWVHPRAHCFAGREDRLPVDSNLLMAMTAPRALLVSAAVHDECDNTKALEAAFRSARPVWEIMGAAERYALLWRAGAHSTTAEDIERYVDWCDLQFGRMATRPEWHGKMFDAGWHFPYEFETWKERSGERIDIEVMPPRPPLAELMPRDSAQWQASRVDRLARLQWLLGEGPAVTRVPVKVAYGLEGGDVSALMGRRVVPEGVEMTRITFGQYIPAMVYHPAGAVRRAEQGGEKMPVAIWLHPDSITKGFGGAYIGPEKMPVPIVRAGFAGLAYDQIGSGYRLAEARHFYDRYPRWSILGKMVADALAAIDAAARLPWADPRRIVLIGAGIGGTAALMAGALDERVAAVASVWGFTPMRPDTPERPTGGIARHALWAGNGMIPRLGYFAGSAEAQRRIPIDFDEIIATLAPRPVVLYTPRVDREANHEDVVAAVESARKVYDLHGAGNRVVQLAPHRYRAFPTRDQGEVYRALKDAMGMQ